MVQHKPSPTLALQFTRYTWRAKLMQHSRREQVTRVENAAKNEHIESSAQVNHQKFLQKRGLISNKSTCAFHIMQRVKCLEINTWCHYILKRITDMCVPCPFAFLPSTTIGKWRGREMTANRSQISGWHRKWLLGKMSKWKTEYQIVNRSAVISWRHSPRSK